MSRSSAWFSVILVASGGMLISGCAEQKPKPGGVTTVSPATKPGTTPTVPEKKEPAEKVKPPADAGSTTGGGVETPGDGQ